ncbi:MAG TPA: SMI1/KNR4 family protein, partial [Abditibacteriaceae bacterium]
MDYIDFKRRIEKDKSENPESWYLPEGVDIGGPPATDDDIARIEEGLGVKLPEDYVAILKDFGNFLPGAEFYSHKADSPFYIVSNQISSELVQNFVGVMPNGCGDDYGFRVVN